ncbi:MAG TPA: MerR family transcriptional regulator [Anaerolineales bacterium]|nr:MerR family transcriptional regulator [Anaerolineales bacterium]
MSQNISNHQHKLSHNVIVKAPGLLPMLYTVRELANELGMPERTLRDWLKRGAPHSLDEQRRTWINGQEFAGWVVAQRRQHRRIPLSDDEGYCLRCNQAVKLRDPVVIPITAKLVHIRGICPICQCVINRGANGG